MNRPSRLFSVVLLMTLYLTVPAPAKTKSRAVRSSNKPVTVTLVRWPYT